VDDMRGDVFFWKWIFWIMQVIAVAFITITALTVWTLALVRRIRGSLLTSDAFAARSAGYAFLIPLTQALPLGARVDVFLHYPSNFSVPVPIDLQWWLYWTAQYAFASTGILLFIVFMFVDPTVHAALSEHAHLLLRKYVNTRETQRPTPNLLTVAYLRVFWLRFRSPESVLETWDAELDRFKRASIQPWDGISKPFLHAPLPNDTADLENGKGRNGRMFGRVASYRSTGSILFDIGKPSMSMVNGDGPMDPPHIAVSPPERTYGQHLNVRPTAPNSTARSTPASAQRDLPSSTPAHVDAYDMYLSEPREDMDRGSILSFGHQSAVSHESWMFSDSRRVDGSWDDSPAKRALHAMRMKHDLQQSKASALEDRSRNRLGTPTIQVQSEKENKWLW